MINQYIKKNLPATLRECREDSYPFFALPRPYNVPCASGMFQEMYYWDTYFTNRGLILDGDVVQAKNNTENLMAMAERLGYTPDVSYDELARGLFAVGESGWDINPRMTYRAYDFATAELNSLIYSIEDNMEFFSRELGKRDDERLWRERKLRRAELCRKYLRDDEAYSLTTI